MNNDLISREALRNTILNDRMLDGSNANWEVNRILVHIEKAPPVPLPDFKEGYKQAILDGKTNYSRPEGEWIIDGCGHAFCNKCNYEEASEDCWAYNYCPRCGADMKGDKK